MKSPLQLQPPVVGLGLYCRMAARVLTVFTYTLFAAISSPAQTTTAELGGDVINKTTSATLQGATVELSGTGRHVLTDASGRFRFTGLPPGDYTVVATYAGLDASTEQVTVKAATLTTINFVLTAEIYQLDTFKVTADREGNAASLTRQRNAGNIVNVVSLDAYGEVAAGNLGYFLQKLPGVAAHFNDGDPVGIMLRGAPPSMSMISVDGTQLLAAASGNTGSMGDRAPAIDRLPAEFIKEVEVTKASTPDMDATGLGGAAKLITKSAFDFKESRVTTFQAGYMLNVYRAGNPLTPSAALTHMQKFGVGEKFAIVLSPTYTKTFGARDRIQPAYTATSDQPSGLRFLDDVNDTIRSGVGIKLEYRPDENLSLYFDVLASRLHKETTRYDQTLQSTGAGRVADYARVSRASIEAGATPRDSANLAAGVAPGSSEDNVELLHGNWINRSAFELRLNDQLTVSTGGTKRWGDTELTARLTTGHDRYDRDFQQFTGRRNGGIGFRIDGDESRIQPVFTQTYGPSVDDFSAYTANQWQLNKSYYNSLEDISSGAVDLKRDFQTAHFPFQLKGGLKYQRQHRETQTWLPVWDYVGLNGVRDVLQFVDADHDYGMFRGLYHDFQKIDYGVARTLFETQPAQFTPTATATAGPLPLAVATEEIGSAYVMGVMTMKALTATAGVRGERTNIEAEGGFNQAGVITRTRREGEYTKYFPSLHFRYEPRRDLVFRASYSTTMARPGIADIVPTTTVTLNSTTGLGTVTQNNTNLGPQYSKNLDFMVEYYLNPVGVLSVGVFRKDIEGFIATQREIIGSGPDNGFDGQFEGYDLVTKRNLNSAEIEGYEIGYDQQLRMLPKPFNTLSLFGNYSHIRTTGSYEEGATALAGFVPETFNAGLTYSYWRLQFRTAYNYTSGYLRAYSATPASNAWLTEAETVGFNVQYKINSWLNASVNWENVFNKYADEYSLNTHRTTVYEVFGSRLTFSVRGRF